MNPKEVGKLLGRDFLVAVFFILSLTGVGAVGSILGLQNIQTNVGSLGTAIGTMNLIALGWIFFTLIATGILAIFWAKASKVIGHYLHIESRDNTSEPKHGYKVKIVAVFIYGTLVTIFISALNLFLQGWNKNLNITSLQSIQQQFVTGNYMLLLGSIIAMAVVGVIVIRLRKLYPTIENSLPKQLDK